jgi:hypothetical protein
MDPRHQQIVELAAALGESLLKLRVPQEIAQAACAVLAIGPAAMGGSACVEQAFSDAKAALAAYGEDASQLPSVPDVPQTRNLSPIERAGHLVISQRVADLVGMLRLHSATMDEAMFSALMVVAASNLMGRGQSSENVMRIMADIIGQYLPRCATHVVPMDGSADGVPGTRKVVMS